MLKKFKDVKVGDTIYAIIIFNFSSLYKTSTVNNPKVIDIHLLEYTVTQAYSLTESVNQVYPVTENLIKAKAVTATMYTQYTHDIKLTQHCDIKDELFVEFMPNPNSCAYHSNQMSFFTNFDDCGQYLNTTHNNLEVAIDEIQKALKNFDKEIKG